MRNKKEQMPRKYVLTGGPGTGKSSIILALEMKGDYVIRESAEDYIKLRQAQGQQEPWTEPNFQDRILKLQIQREARIPSDAKRVFIDRGLADGLAYESKGTKTYEKIRKETEKVMYEKVFLIEPIGSTEKTEVRRENHEEAVKIGEKLNQLYKKLGYQPIKINSGHLEERVQEIMQKI